MSKYTTEIRYICETEYGLSESKGYNSVDMILDKTCTKIFDFDFPIFQESYRKTLEKKILKHYYRREIGFETVGLFKLYLSTRMNEIMPYYNMLYESFFAKKFNLFDNVNITKTTDGVDVLDGNKKDTGSVTDDHDGTSWSLYSDTPQGGITGLANNKYLTDATKNTIDTTDKKTLNTREKTDNTTTRNEKEIIKGKNGGKTYAELLKEYEGVILDIDMMIIRNLSDLFLNLW